MFLELSYLDNSVWKIDAEFIANDYAAFHAAKMNIRYREDPDYNLRYQKSFNVEKKMSLLNTSYLIDWIKEMPYNKIQPHLYLVKLPSLDYSKEFYKAKIKIVD